MTQLAHRLAALNDEGPATSPSDLPNMQGPTSTSNWLIPGVIIVGDTPKGAKLAMLIDTGVQRFVDLRSIATNYLEGTQVDAATLGIDSAPQYANFDLQHYVSMGNSVATAKTAAFLKSVLATAIGHEEVTYVHCDDGHSLVTVASCALLSYVYGITGMKSTAVAAQLHGCRQDNDSVHQLLNANQKAFVRALAEDTNAISESLVLLRSNSTVSLDDPANHSATDSPHHGSTNSNGPRPPNLGLESLTQEGSSHTVHSGVFNSANNTPSKGAGGPNSSGRFKSSHGQHGGGATHINVFSDGADDNTPTRRGRAAVPGMTQEAVHPHKPSTPHRSPVMSEGIPSGSSTPHGARLASGNTTPHVRLAQPMASYQPSLYMDPMPQSRVVLQRSGPSVQWGITLHGVVVVNVQHRSPAENAGVLVGSLLRCVDGYEYDIDSTFDQVTRGQLSVRLTLDAGYRDTFLRTGKTPLKDANAAAADSPARSHRDPTSPDQSVNRSLNKSLNAAVPPVLNTRTEKAAIQGPAPTSNWFVRGIACCGAHPDPRQKQFAKLTAEKFTTFVTLTEQDESGSYVDEYARLSGVRDIRVMHFPIKDGCTVPQQSLANFTKFAGEVADVVRSGEKVYVHCRRGHGRTGLLVSCVLSNLYKMNGMRAVNLCDALHSCRIETEDYNSPENQEQRTFIISLCSTLE